MSALVFSLHVPGDPGYRSIASEVVGRYLDLIGSAEPERKPFTEAFARAVDTVMRDSVSDLEVKCTSRPSGFELTLRCGGRSAVIRHPAEPE